MSKATSYATNSTLSIQAQGETDEDQLWARQWVQERAARAIQLAGIVHPENGTASPDSIRPGATPGANL